MQAIKLYIGNITKSNFTKKLLNLFTGTAISQVIPLMCSPLFSRIYKPADFGIFSIFIAISALLSVISTGRYSLAIMVEKDMEQRKQLFIGSFLICIIFSLTVFICCVIIRNYSIASFLSSIDNCILLAIGTFLLGANQLLGFWFNKSNQLKLVSYSKIFQGVSTGIGTLVFGYFKSDINGLMEGYIVGMLCANLFFLNELRKQFQNINFRLSEIKEVLKKHKEFPIYSMPGAFMDSVALQLPTLIVSYLFTKDIVGYWGFTIRLIQVPASLISFSLSQTLFQRFSEVKDLGKIKTDIKKIVKGLGAFIIPFVIIILLAGPFIFSKVFGNTWYSAGEYAQILILCFAIKFIITPISILFSAINRIKTGTHWQLIYFIGTIFWLTTCIVLKVPVFTFIWVYSIHEFILYCYYYYLMQKVLSEQNIN
jgi:O-antigen/teichoic acid export membrane protein